MWINDVWGGDDYWIDYYWTPGDAPTDDCPAFRLFKQDCEMEIKGWGSSGAYQQVSPFGGRHQEPPSGAEI